MTILAGEIVSAGRLARLQPRVYSARASGAISPLTTTETDVPGCSITLTTEEDDATYEVEATVDVSVSVTNTTTLAEGRLTVDGVLQQGRAVHAMDTADRDTVVGIWSGTLDSAGSHTFVLRGAINAASGTAAIQPTNTAFKVKITEVV